MLNALKSRVSLKHKISIYVPGTCGVSAAADNSEWVERAAEGLSRLYGGATCQNATGYWMSDAEGLVAEDVKIVYAFCDDPEGVDGEKINQVLAFCESMKKELQQEAISLEIDNELFFI